MACRSGAAGHAAAGERVETQQARRARLGDDHIAPGDDRHRNRETGRERCRRTVLEPLHQNLGSVCGVAAIIATKFTAHQREQLLLLRQPGQVRLLAKRNRDTVFGDLDIGEQSARSIESQDPVVARAGDEQVESAR